MRPYEICVEVHQRIGVTLGLLDGLPRSRNPFTLLRRARMRHLLKTARRHAERACDRELDAVNARWG